MEKTKLFAIVAIAIILVAAIGVTYVLTSNMDNQEQTETTVTDTAGRTVNIPQQID